jgi:hypothetical protein
VYNDLKEYYKPSFHLLGYDFSVVCRPINILANHDHVPTGNIQHGFINENLAPKETEKKDRGEVFILR